MPRVLHVLEATRGGTRAHVLDLLPALAARGWACGLVYSSDRNPDFARDAKYLRSLGIECWDVPMERAPHPRHDALAARRIVEIARGFGPDLLHAHSTKAGGLARLAAPLLSPLARPPVVYTPHCVAFEALLPPAQRAAARWAEMALAPLTARFIAVSQAEATALHRVLPIGPTRVALVRNGLGLSRFVPHEAPQVLAANDGALTIGCFGRLSAQKNQAVLLQALKLLRNGGVNARLLLVGGGEDEAKLRDLAQVLEVSSGVEWTGEVEDARPFYARCDVVELPSRWEGCPYSLLEAMALGRAVVASDIVPLREILKCDGEPCGVLVRSRAWDLARAIGELGRDVERRAHLGRAARARVESAFTLGRMVEETQAVYRKAL